MTFEPTNSDLAELGDRAKRVLESLEPDHNPVVAELAGSPKSGKSTSIEILAHFLKRTGFKVWAPAEGASKRTPYHLKRDLVAFNTWTLNYAISEMLVAYYNVDHHNVIFLDRGPFDSLAWMALLKRRKEIPDHEFDVVKDFAMHPRWSKLISRLYLFKCEPDVSLERENQSKLTRLPGTAMNPKMLAELLEQYRELEEDLKQYPLKVVETSHNTSPLSTSYDLMCDLLEVIETTQRGLSKDDHSG
jgi:thymidylate kinase